MNHFPEPGSFHLTWAGDLFEVALRLDRPRKGRAVFRTNLGMARVRRQELIACTESGEPVLARDWHDIPMRESEPDLFRARVPLTEVGVFEGKACFFAEGSHAPEWPAGPNLRIKIGPAHTACANTVYSAFVRQFGASLHRVPRDGETAGHERALDGLGYTVIPPSGTFRDLARRLDHIMGRLGFRVVQLLPVHPVPTVYGRMGRYGSAFAALDFLSVDPALAEFDTRATPLDQFRELIDAVHARGGYLFMDLPANHTGWAATLQTHHPDWYRRKADGEFVSPGAWGVTWADLVELDYRDPRLRAYMAKVFLFWCSQGVDGFRCDAGYMIPAETWTYIVARVREEFPDTVFLLEGLGGKVEVTEALLTGSGLDWAYSELFQTEDRGAMEWYLPRAIPLAERCGPLIHFAETHDNNRLAARGEIWSRMRVALSALLSHQGAFGITAGVEWFAAEKIDVHGASGLNWDAPRNQAAEIARLNALLAGHPAFGPGTRLRLVTRGEGPVLAVVREEERSTFNAQRSIPKDESPLLVLVNFDCEHGQTVRWDDRAFHAPVAWDLLTGEAFALKRGGGVMLAPGRVCCLTANNEDVRFRISDFGLDQRSEGTSQDSGLRTQDSEICVEPEAVARRRRNLMALRVRLELQSAGGSGQWAVDDEPDALGAEMAADPDAYCQLPTADCSFPRVTHWNWPEDLRRQVMVPEGNVLLVYAGFPFRAELKAGRRTQAAERAVRFDDGRWGVFLTVAPYAAGLDGTRAEPRVLVTAVYTPEGTRRGVSELLVLPPAGAARAVARVGGVRVRAEPDLCAVLSNGAGAMAQARAAWGELRSQYDCLLGVNPDPRVPADKMVFWTRCRTWLRYRGYSQEINAACLDTFESDPTGRFAEWSFKVPCGMGRWVPLRFRLELEEGANRARLTIGRAGDLGVEILDFTSGTGDQRSEVGGQRSEIRGQGSEVGNLKSKIQSQKSAIGCLPDDDAVTVIVRPDIEWRSFHQKTKAFLGPERAWPAAVALGELGFVFRPAAGVDLRFEISDFRLGNENPKSKIQNPKFHHGPEWAYMVAHPEEQERGLDGHGDLFSPGWFELPLAGGDEAVLTAGDLGFEILDFRFGIGEQKTENRKQKTESGSQRSEVQNPKSKIQNPKSGIPDVLSQALSLYIVRRDALKTVIAGYPWFLDWGRDTLIALRGLIADGRHGEALAILREFGRFEERGTLPNIIHGETVGNRDTSDAPLWFCVAAGDLMEAAGDREVLEAACGRRALREVLVSIVSHFRDGTPNGIRMDPASGLIYSPPHFTWMDTNYPACTPREGYPVEIQALWIASLRLVAKKTDATWMALAEQAVRSLAQLFVVPQRCGDAEARPNPAEAGTTYPERAPFVVPPSGGLRHAGPNPERAYLADCLRAGPGTPAERAVREDVVRPNQLLAVTLGVPLEPALARGIVRSCEALLVPGAIRSLADAPVPEGMYPYCGHYLGDEDTRRKPAYHNGTAWTWPFPLYAEALAEVYGGSARAAGLSLLGSAVELINRGCLGHTPEICDGDAPHAARGCRAQAWGVSELLRVAKKLREVRSCASSLVH